MFANIYWRYFNNYICPTNTTISIILYEKYGF